MKIDEHHFSALCLLSKQELTNYSKKIHSLIDVVHGHHDPEVTPESTRTAPPSLNEMTGLNFAQLRQRPPMRTPQPGSVRASVHEFLKLAGKPMQRADIVRGVAAERGVPISKLLDAKIGDALGNRHDLQVKKISKGVYAYTPEKREDHILCL